MSARSLRCERPLQTSPRWSSKSLFKYVWKMVIFLCLSFLPHVLGKIFCRELSFFNEAFYSPPPSRLPCGVRARSAGLPPFTAAPPPSGTHLTCGAKRPGRQGVLCFAHSNVSTSQEQCDRVCFTNIYSVVFSNQ